MALSLFQQHKAPKTSWWADAKDRKTFRAALEHRVAEGMATVATPTLGLSRNTATMVAKRRKKAAGR